MADLALSAAMGTGLTLVDIWVAETEWGCGVGGVKDLVGSCIHISHTSLSLLLPIFLSSYQIIR